jgi:hypothetical protein
VVVQQNAVDAEYGFSAGGVLNLSMKSGTNDFHGSAYWFGRNPVFNAVVDPITRTESVVKNNIWGGTIGNPIKKNKLFNFFSYERWKATQPSSNVSTVPTDLERAGDFSKTFTPQGDLRVIYDPFSTQFDPATSTVTRTPFEGNKIPAQMIDPTGQKIINDLWKPNRTGDDPSGVNNFKTAYAWWVKYWNFSDRVDYNHSEKLRMYWRYSRFETRLDNPNWGGTRAVRSDNGGLMDALNAAFDTIYMISPRTTLNLRMGVTYAEDDYDSAWAQVGNEVWADLFPTKWYEPVTGSLPGIYYPNFNFNGNGSASAGLSGWWLVRERQYNGQANLTHTMGMHNLKFGFQVRHSYGKNGSPSPGGFNFNSVETGSSFLGYDSTQSGSQFATALLGVISSGNAAIQPMWDHHLNQFGFYVQDDIKLNRNVTLNLGGRFEIETAPKDVSDFMFTRYLDLTNPIPELQGVTLPAEVTAIAKTQPTFNGAWVFTDSNNPRNFPTLHNFLPRVGVAVRLNDKMSFRAGYARYATPIRGVYGEAWDIPKYGYSQSSATLDPLQGVPRTLISDPFPTSNPLRLPLKKALGRYTQLGSDGHWFNQDLTAPKNDRFNLSLQRQMPGNFLFDGTFFMHFGHNVQDGSMWGGSYNQQINFMDPNLAYTYKGAVDQAVPNPFYQLLPPDKMPGELRTQEEVSVRQLLRPYPQYTSLQQFYRKDISDHYYAMQLQLQRSMSQGVTLQLGYNYNHEIHGEFFNDIDEYNLKTTMIDRRRPRHSLRMAGTWELPFGKGRKYLGNAPRALDLIVGGWSTAHWLMWQGGNLLTFGQAEVSGDPKANVPAGLWFNPSVFAVSPGYTPRTNPWYYSGLRGPRFWSLDSTLVKYFPITERARLEIRFEFYNMPNHFIPSDPDVGIGSGTMGQSTWVYGGNYGREVQYTARIHF